MNQRHHQSHAAIGYGRPNAGTSIPQPPPMQQPLHTQPSPVAPPPAPHQTMHQGQHIHGQVYQQPTYGQPVHINPMNILMGEAGRFAHQGGTGGFANYGPGNNRQQQQQPYVPSPSDENAYERYRQQVLATSSNVAFQYYRRLKFHDKTVMGLVYEEFDFFLDPNKTGTQDAVVKEFIAAINRDEEYYGKVCLYGTLLFTYLMTDLAMNRVPPSVYNSQETQFEKLKAGFRDSLALMFLDWLEHHPEAINYSCRLSFTIREKLINFESNLKHIKDAIVSLTPPGTQGYPFPWVEGTFDRISKKAYTGFDIYANQYMGYSELGHGNQPVYNPHPLNLWPHTESATPSVETTNSPPIDDDWFREAIKESRAYYSKNQRPPEPLKDVYGRERVDAVQTEDVIYESDIMNLVSTAKRITPENRFEDRFNPYHFFKRIPGTEKYLIHPVHFKYISKVLTYMGNGAPYYKNGYLVNNAIPVVELDWQAGTYNYTNIFIGEDMVNVALTDPEIVLPDLEKEARSLDVYDDDYVDLADLVKENSVVLKECKELGKLPKIVYASKPLVAYNNMEVLNGMKYARAAVEEKLDYRPDAMVLPLINRAATTISDNYMFKYEDFVRRVPELVTGAEITQTGYEYLETINNKIESFNSHELKCLVRNHFSRVINRWLVERHFFSRNENDPNYFQVGDVLEDIAGFKAALDKQAGSASRDFKELYKNEFLKENLTMFASLKDFKAYEEEELAKVKDEAMKEGAKETLKKTVLLEKRCAVIMIDPAKPYVCGEPVIIEGSNAPKMAWVVNNIPQKLRKHFNRDVPPVISFNKETTPRLWAATPSSYCTSKVSMTLVDTSTALALFKVRV